jgi:hypothetical protein
MNLQAYEQFIKDLTKFNWIYNLNADFLFEFKVWKQTHSDIKFEHNLNLFKPKQIWIEIHLIIPLEIGKSNCSHGLIVAQGSLCPGRPGLARLARAEAFGRQRHWGVARVRPGRGRHAVTMRGCG